MEPTIGHSIRQGLRSVNRSWRGMAFLAGGYMLMGLLGFLVVTLTGMPRELLQQPGAAQETTGQRAPGGAVAGEAPAPGDAATAVDEEEAARVEAEERGRLALEWLRRAWPVLIVAFLVFMAGSLWLQGGQIGYLARMVQTQQSGVSEFWISGARALPAFLGGTLIAFPAYGVVALGIVLLGVLFGVIGNVLPNWLMIILALLLIVGLVVAFVWLGVRLAFWFIGIVIDRIGPIAGLKATFRATRGRWWRAFGLLVLLVLISFGVSLAMNLLGFIGTLLGGLLGGFLAVVMVVIASILGAVANLYVGFWVLGALIQFYADATSAPSIAVSAGGGLAS